METNKILDADVLDIIFDGRNKAYGAYTLRKNYNKRLATAMAGMGFVLLVFFVGSVLANALGKKNNPILKIEQVVTLDHFNDPKPPPVEPPPPLPPVSAPAPRVQTEIFTPPVIVPNEEVKPEDTPPDQDKLEVAKIGNVHIEGTADDGIASPPVEKVGTGNIVMPVVKEEDFIHDFRSIEIPAKFLGGVDAWRRYLERNLQYPEAAIGNGTQATVRVQLVVDKNGNVSEVKALNDPGDGLAAEAERVIKKGPKWEPAEQNGRKVTYRFIQSITFTIQ